MLTIALSVVAYLFTGYTIGKVANGEYFDNTPTEELGPFRKVKRILLFPYSYHAWSDRLKNHHSDGPSIRLLSESYDLPATEEIRERYCRATTFLWPFKLIQASVGIVEIAYFGTTKALYGVSQIPSQSTKYLGTGIKSLGKTTRKLLPASSDLSSHIDEIESCLTDIEARRNPLYAQKENLEKEINELSKNLSTWQVFLSKSKPEDLDYVQIKEITEALAKEMDQRRKKIDNLTSTIATFADRESRLKYHFEKLAQCKKTMTLGIPIASAVGEGLIKDDAIAILARTTISSAQSYIAECKELLEKT
ncbi:MAG: hypothetical protein Q8R55_07630 [Candidatus Taylorbacteria bacterium]|nr:hypothetical protein [Candidatus Taylorbacteria bacterium]